MALKRKGDTRALKAEVRRVTNLGRSNAHKRAGRSWISPCGIPSCLEGHQEGPINLPIKLIGFRRSLSVLPIDIDARPG